MLLLSSFLPPSLSLKVSVTIFDTLFLCGEVPPMKTFTVETWVMPELSFSPLVAWLSQKKLQQRRLCRRHKDLIYWQLWLQFRNKLVSSGGKIRHFELYTIDSITQMTTHVVIFSTVNGLHYMSVVTALSISQLIRGLC